MVRIRGGRGRGQPSEDGSTGVRTRRGKGKGRGRGRPRSRGAHDPIVYVGQREIGIDRDITQSQISVSVRSEEEQRDGTRSHRSSNAPRSPIGLTEIAQMCTGGSVAEEAESSQSLVNVGGYRVKNDVAPLLGRVFSKYGDIARDSCLQSLETRVSFFEIVCTIIQRLEMSSFKAISIDEVNKMLGNVQDLERVKPYVGWLRNKLEQTLEVKRMVRDYPSMKEKKASIEAKKQQLESSKADLAALQENLIAVKKEIHLINQELQEMTSDYEEGIQKYVEMQYTIKDALQKDLVDGLF